MVSPSSGGVPGMPRTPSVPKRTLDMSQQQLGEGRALDQRTVTVTLEGSICVTPMPAPPTTVTGRL